MKRAARPGTAMIRALTELGLTHGHRGDFCVSGAYHRGERTTTVVVFYSRRAEAIVIENANRIEHRCDELGWFARVRTLTVTYDSRVHGQRVITSSVHLSN
jgi:hypothetical protein